MTDLFVYTADADAQAVLRSILARPSALGIRKITHVVERHWGRDPGMVKDGPEFVRWLAPKAKFRKVLLLWDYQGANWTHSPEECVARIHLRLDGVSWKDHSGAVVIVPELEEWFWHNTTSICKLLEIGERELSILIARYCHDKREEHEEVMRTNRKELFRFVLYEKQQRKPLPSDFEQIGKAASLRAWQKSSSFAQLVSILQDWFES